MSKAEKATLITVAIYFAVVLVCFGPATVESERAEALYEATCDPQPGCRYHGPKTEYGFFKALFWPFWLSYKVASYEPPDKRQFDKRCILYYSM